MSTTFPTTANNAVPALGAATSPTGGTSTITQARQILAGAYDTIRGHVRRVGATADGVLGRLGARVETYVGAKIRRRVKPPILAAILVAGIALAIAAIALTRK